MKQIVLASSSPRRKKLLEKAGLNFIVDPSSFDEESVVEQDPKKLAELLSYKKAEEVARRHPDAITIGADTVVCLNGELLAKPKTEHHAKEMLHKLSGKKHIVVTGYTLISRDTVRTNSFSSNIYFKQITSRQINEYVASGEPMDKAGAYGIQGKGRDFVEKIEGDYDAVVGLPVKSLLADLKAVAD